MGHALGNNYGKSYAFQSKPVHLDLQFTVDATVGAGVSTFTGQGVKQVWMHTSTTPSTGNPNPAAGYAIIELEYNYRQCFGGPWNIQSPKTGSELAINASALTAGIPYEITTVGAASNGAVTIAPVADTAGSLASTWFDLFDAYGNIFRIYFIVSGVGSAPSSAGVTLVPVNIVSGDTASTIGTLLTTQIGLLPSGISGVYSFTAAGTTTVTATSTSAGPVAGPPKDGTVATGFTFAKTVYNTNNTVWQAVGLPAGIVPALGVCFVATAIGYSTHGGSSGKVKALGVSAIFALEILGAMNQTIAPIPMGGSPNSGGYIVVQFLGPTIATSVYDSPMIPTAPAAGSKVYMQLLLEQGTPVGGNNE